MNVNYICLKKLATEIGVSLRTVKRWASNSDRPLKTVLLGSTRVTTREWVEEFSSSAEKPEPVLAHKAKEQFLAKWGQRKSAG